MSRRPIRPCHPERVNRLELRVCQSDLDQQRQVIALVKERFQRSQRSLYPPAVAAHERRIRQRRSHSGPIQFCLRRSSTRRLDAIL